MTSAKGSGYCRQTCLLLRKNYLLKRRALCGTICEILAPVTLIVLLLVIYSLVHEHHTDTQQFLVEKNGSKQIITSQHNQKVRPFAFAPYLLQQANAKVALVPGPGDDAKQFRDDFHTAMNQRYPGIELDLPKFPAIPGFDKIAWLFDSEKELNKLIESNSSYAKDSPIVWAAIVFNHRDEDKVDYSIRMNISSTPTTDENVDILQRDVNFDPQQDYIGTDIPRGNTFSHQVPGFLTLQNMVDRFVIDSPIDEDTVDDDFFMRILCDELMYVFGGDGGLCSGQILAVPENIKRFLQGELYAPQLVRMAPFPVKGFTSNEFYQVVANALPLLLLITFLAPTSSLIRGVVLEKENRIREGMQMMGLKTSALYSSWFWTYAVIFFVVALAISAITKASFFSHSDFFALFILFFAFGISTTAFCFMVAVFFSRAKTGATVGVLLYFGAFFPFYAVQGPTHSASEKTSASLMSPTAFAQAVVTLSDFEDRGQGIQFGKTANLEFRNYSFSLGLGMIIIDTLIYLLLAWYFDKVWPREYGVRSPFYFMCTPTYWKNMCGCCKSRNRSSQLLQGFPTTNELAEHDSLIEPVSNDALAKEKSNKAVRVANLRKEFDSGDDLKVAVNDLSMNIHEGEVFVLLGHNGAGKTTTISMLTGLTAPTSGKMHIYDEDVSEDLESIRKYLGVCPQHDVLWDSLTVDEHLRLYAGLKGVPGNEIDSAVNDVIRDVGLTEKVNAQSSQLSGGQKRKLSVAIALIGDSKVVILDEPTSGMDPYSRRSTWDIIQNARRDRIILMTTHFMDEADILGDRICIMAHGKLKCCGSGMFLKNKYGVGYLLTAVKKSGKGTNGNLVRMIQDHIPEAEVQSEVGTELSVRLPMTSSSKFPLVLGDMDDNLERYGIETYGLSATTLEEVFLRVAHDEDETYDGPSLGGKVHLKSGDQNNESRHSEKTSLLDKKAPREPSAMDTTPVVGENGSERKEFSIEEVRRQARELSQDSFGRHFRALFMKRFHYYKRDAKAACFQLVVPILAVLFGLLLIRAGQIGNFPSYLLSTGNLNLLSNGSTRGNPLRYSTFLDAGFEDAHLFAQRFDDVVRSIPSRNATLLPYTRENAANQDDYFQFFRDTFGGGYNKQGDYVSQYEALVNMTSWMLQGRNSSSSGASMYGAYSAIVEEGMDTTRLNDSSIFMYLIQQNSTAFHACPMFMSLLNGAFYQGRGNRKLIARNHPLPFTDRQSTLISGASSFAAAMIIVLAFAFIPASYAIFVVKEREISAKHQQLISGVSIPAYWCSTFVWDFTSYLLPMAGTIVMISIFHVHELISTENQRLAALFLLFLFYGTSVSGFTYCLTFFFKNYSSAQNFVLMINMMAMVLVLASFIMSQISSTCEANEGLKYIYFLFPGYSLGNGLVDLAFLSVLPQLHKCGGGGGGAPGKSLGALDIDAALPNILYMAVLSVVYFLLALGIDYVLSRPDWLQKVQPKPKAVNERPLRPSEIDPDVEREAQRCDSQGERYSVSDDVILLQHLRKVYRGGKVAVRDISFGVPVGEVFGFLGINGAGKTSTLKMLTGDILPTSGRARLAGYDIISEQNELRTLLGYCPQFEALLELLTVREHLHLYARIKGISDSDIERVIQEKLNQLSLIEFENKRAGSLSGGNKRKLSVAIALIGNPPILFLDEPSTGMDPVTRRVMWDVIADIATTRKEASIVLTTHSMEECEALATRVGIMVGGRLRCLGSIQHIKNTHAQGYQMRIKLGNPSEETISTIETTIVRTLQQSQPNSPDLITESSLSGVCAALGDSAMESEIQSDGSGWMIYHSIKNSPDNAASIKEFTQWWAEERQIKLMLEYVLQKFEGSELIERQGSLLTLKIPPQNMRLSTMFGILEQGRSQYNIREYALSQTSLEQVFNYFAAQQEEEQGTSHGFISRQVSQNSNSHHSLEIEADSGDGEMRGSLKSSLLSDNRKE